MERNGRAGGVHSDFELSKRPLNSQVDLLQHRHRLNPRSLRKDRGDERASERRKEFLSEVLPATSKRSVSLDHHSRLYDTNISQPRSSLAISEDGKDEWSWS